MLDPIKHTYQAYIVETYQDTKHNRNLYVDIQETYVIVKTSNKC